MGIEIKISDNSPEYAHISVSTGNDVTCKKISCRDLIDMLQQSSKLDPKEENIRIGPVPYGYVTGSIRRDGSFSAVIKIPAGKRPLLYDGGSKHLDTFVIPFPSLIFKLEVKNRHLVGSKCYAAEDTPADTKLYHYPFGNVYGTAEICWGNCKLPEIDMIVDLDRIIELFFAASTNEDLFTASPEVAKKCGNQIELFEFLKKQERFPIDFLSPTGLTLGDLCE